MSEPAAVVRVLEADPSLAAGLSDAARERATREAVASTVLLAPGRYPPASFARHQARLGLLVIDGVMIRHVTLAGRSCGELVGPGALLRPWDQIGEHAPLPFDVSWRVLQPCRLALLDDRFLLIAARTPALTEALIERTVRRSQTLALSVAIHCLQHVWLRVLCLLWHLADRFGFVTVEGTIVPLALTHNELAELTGSQRATVSKAIAELERRGRLARRCDRSWLLLGDPPSELRDLHPQRDRAPDAPAAPAAGAQAGL